MGRRLAILALCMLLTGCGELPNAIQDLGGIVPSDSGTGGPAQDDPSIPTPPVQQRLNSLPCEPFTRFSAKADSVPGDPVNLLLVGDEGAVTEAISRAGWLKADPITAETEVKITEATLLDTPYPTAPMSYLFLFGRRQDVGYQKNSEHVRRRDHFRIWKTEAKDPSGHQVWAIAATRDVGIRIIKGPTHIISPKIDWERDYVAKTLEETHRVRDRYRIPGIGHPYQGKNGGGDPYETDGNAGVLVIGS